jgi:hypothetical protein
MALLFGLGQTFAVTPSTASVNEGSSVTFTTTTTNVSNGTTLYWSLNTVSGTINASDFNDGAVTGSFAITNNSGSVTLTLANDATTEGTESFQLQVRTGSTSGTIVATSSTVTISDTSLNSDFTISPSVNGITNWFISANGALILDGGGGPETTYTLVAQRSFSSTVKMWGEGKSGNTGGYSTGTVSFANGTTYTVRLNMGRGAAGQSYGWVGGENGGGYSGLFITSSLSQGNAIMIAGAAGGTGFGHGSAPGGAGGGSSGSNGTNSPDSQIGSTGGSGGTQGGAGGGGGGGGQPGSALQGGTGGAGQLSGYSNAGGGGGGGGGYFGGGGGGGGNDFGSSTRIASGGGGGSGYINGSYVSGGSTGGWQDAPNRGSAGQTNGPARVVIG